MTSDATTPRPELVLGTANWAGSYGAPGREATVDEAVARSLAAAFLAAGHTLVDTAPAYGRAEDLVGTVLDGAARVISKVPSSVMTEPDAPALAVASLQRSLARTRVPRFAGVLLHDPGAATRGDTAGRDMVSAVRDADLADRVGVSVYAPEEAYAAVDRLGSDLVQVPCNVLDQRFLTSGCIQDLRAAGVEVHVRSVFLNGVVLSEPGSLQGSLTGLAEPVARLHSQAAAAGCTPFDLALEFARVVAGCHAVIVGAFAVDQLREVLDAWASPANAGQIEWDGLAASNVEAVDPRTWFR
jgi:aryl-alcohol dehydrogenase-like predicted oxidoreductase